MRRIFRLFRPKGYRVSFDKADSSLLYRERGRRLHVSGEAMADGIAVYASSIKQWETSPAELLNDIERQRIAVNIRAYFVDRGKTVYIA